MKRLAFLLLLVVFAVQAFPQNSDDRRPPGTPGEGGQGEMARRGRGVGGTITAITPDSLTLKTFNGATATVKLGPDTKFMKDRQPVQSSDFKVGDMVMVRGEKTGDDTWTAATVMSRSEAGMQRMREGLGKEFIAGEIKSIDGTKLTIQRIDNVAQTIEVDENTSFRKDGQSVTLADFKPGDHVMGRGQLKDGVFVPTMLVSGQFGMMRRREGGQQPPQPPQQ